MEFPRALLGYSPVAVRAARTQIEAYYQLIADELARQMAVQESGPASVFSPERMKADAPRPSGLRWALFGYKRRAVEASFAELHRLWQSDLEWLAADLARIGEPTAPEPAEPTAPVAEAVPEPVQAEAEPIPVPASPAEVAEPVEGMAQQPDEPVEEMAQQPDEPVEEMAPPLAAPKTPARVVPMRRRTDAPEPQAVPRPRLQAAWRPGAIEEFDGVTEPVLLPVPRQAEAARLVVNRGSAVSSLAAVPESVSVPAPIPTPAAAPFPALAVEAQVQLGLAERLDILFQRFLVGKAVGADLVLPTGQVLAASGAQITRELVQQAEEAGLLPSLIANMTIPGLTE